MRPFSRIVGMLLLAALAASSAGAQALMMPVSAKYAFCGMP